MEERERDRKKKSNKGLKKELFWVIIRNKTDDCTQQLILYTQKKLMNEKSPRYTKNKLVSHVVQKEVV